MKRRHSPMNEDIPSRRPRLEQDPVAQVQQEHGEKSRMMEVDVNTDIDMDSHSGPMYVKTEIYWGKEKYDVEVDLNEPLVMLKAQLFALTQVAPERQKIIYKGKILKDEGWPNINIKSGSELRMVGTNDVIEIPTVTEEEIKAGINGGKEHTKLPPFGIKNFGNTCYMNSVLQLVRSIKDLRSWILKTSCEPDGNIVKVTEAVVTMTMKELFKSLDERNDNYERWMKEFINNLETLYPEYAGGIEKGGRPQQDANEFFMRMMSILKKTLLIPPTDEKLYERKDIIDTYFGIDVEKRLTCSDPNGESPKSSTQVELQLSCFIDANTKRMLEGIKKGLFEDLTKFSTQLDREVPFSISTSITRLPEYLCVQMVRFFFKEKESVNAKILKDVKFPQRLDVSELCNEMLREKIKPMQVLVRDFENQLALADQDAMKALFKKAENGIISLPEQNLGVGTSGSGLYELTGVMTHQGRSTSSGHYVAWVKLEHKCWAKLDDQTTTFVEEEDILKLSGGGESHSAYLLIYQAIRIPRPE